MTAMTVTRALAELKRFDDRIYREHTGNAFIGVVTGKGALQRVHTTGANTPEQLSKTIQSSFDTVQSLIDQRQKIKAAVVVSNALQTITLGGKTMTVAEAIELKKSVEYKRQFIQTLQSQYNVAVASVASINQKLEAAIDTMATSVMGSSDKSKFDSSTYEAIAAPQRNAKEASLLDPKNIADQIKKLTSEVELIELELDFLLSESNAKTTIEV